MTDSVSFVDSPMRTNLGAVRKIVALTIVVFVAVSCSGGDSGGGVDRALISSTAEKALSRLQDSAATLGRGQLSERVESSIKPYLFAMKEVAQTFPDAGGDDRKSKNVLTYVGLSLTTL